MHFALRKYSLRLLLLVCFFCLAQCATATTVTIPPDDDLIIGARAIIRAKVLAVNCSFDEQQRIYTYITLRVREVIKGRIPSSRIVIKESGGQVGPQGTIIYGTAQFKPGEEVLLYLDTWNDGSLRVHQMFLGKFRVIDDPQTGQQMVVREPPDARTVIIDTQNHIDAQRQRGSITNRSELSAYVRMVKRRLAVNLERSAQFERTYYSGVSILRQPPEYSRAEKGGFHPLFNFISSPPVRWFEPDDGLPIIFTVNLDGAPNAQVLDDITAAMNAWSNIEGCSMRVVAGDTGAFCYARNLNSMVFNNCDGQFAPTPFCASILAIGGLSWGPGQTKIVNGVTFVPANTGHISFNPYAGCAYEDHCQVREIATHELGHALGLGHSWNPCSICPPPTASQQDATMYGIAHFDGRCASLKQDDINGIRFMYPASTTGPGPLAILTESPLQLGLVSKPYSQSLIAVGGATPYSWSILADSGSLPDGLSMSAAGVISGTPVTAGASNFTVKLTDAHGDTAQKPFSIIVTTVSSDFDSQFVSQTVPATLQPSQAFGVNIKFLNTGSKVLDGTNGIYLRSQNPPQNGTWGGDLVPIFLPPVAPGAELDLTFIAFAPRISGTYNFQWQLYNDGVGFFGQMSENVRIVVGDGGSDPSINNAASVEAVKGQAFTFPLAASGGTPPYQWQIVSGSLPSGITLNLNSGLIAGAPADTGSAAFTVRVTDAGSRKAEKAIIITVLPPPLDLATDTLANAQQGSQFNHQFAAAGGKPPYTWAIVAGTLPAGLGLNATSGMLSGVPAAAGNFNFTVEVKDAESRQARKAMSLVVAPPSLSIQTATLLEGSKGTAFTYQPVATGGHSPYTWQVASGALPPGVTINASTGLISGIPTAAGTFAVVISVRDQDGRSANGNAQIKITDPATIPVIKKVKYKAGKKLTVKGDRVDPAAVLMIDGTRMSVSPEEGQFIVKRLALSSGRHEIRILNPGDAASQIHVLIVN